MNKIVLMLALLLFISCENAGDDEFSTVTFSGVVQKGPFIQGTPIIIQGLNDDLNPSGLVYLTETKDDFGAFTVGNVKAGLLELNATGYYFNEIVGQLSQSTLTLKALAFANGERSINVNILTTLSVGRIKYLIATDKKSFDEAKRIAEEEVLKVFSIDAGEMESFEEVDLSTAVKESSILLAISCMLQNDNTEASLSELINKLSSDLEPDGILDNASTAAALKLSAMTFNENKVNQIISNLENRYLSLGVSVTIPNFLPFIDTNGDGVVVPGDVDPSLPYPSIDKLAGVYNKDITITITAPGSKIYYTLDGQDPTIGSPVYTGPINIAGDGTFKTLKAFVGGPNNTRSEMLTSYYKIDYASNPEQFMTGLSLDDYKSIMSGKWVGYLRVYYAGPPFIYYNVENTIGDDGSFAKIIQYSSWSENSSYRYPYYDKFNSIKLSSIQADGRAGGTVNVIDPEWPISEVPAIVKDVAISDDGDHLKFTIVYSSWPFEHHLIRKPE